jgi:alpha-beta hydrolase superfamily lysophospholipase
LAAASAVAVPVLLAHGGEDPLVLASGSRQFAEAVQVSGSELRIYPELRHEILNEPEWESVLGDLLDWLAKRGQGAEGMA